MSLANSESKSRAALLNEWRKLREQLAAVERQLDELAERDASDPRTVQAASAQPADFYALPSVVNQAPFVVWALDPDGTFRLSEGGGLKFAGLQPGEVVGRSVFDLYAGHPRVCADAARALAGESPTSLMQFRERTFTCSYYPLHDGAGEFAGTVGFAADVTQLVDERRASDRAGETLRLSIAEREAEIRRINAGLQRETEERRQLLREHKHQETLLQITLDALGEGVILTDAAGKFLQFNPVAAEILQVGPTESGPAGWSEHYGLFYPDQTTPYPAEELPLARAMRGETVREAELFMRNARRPEGVWLRVTATPVRDESGQVGGGVAVFRDVSEQKAAEIALQQLLAAQERERQLVAYDIHDGLVQLVTGALMHLDALTASGGGPEAAAEPLEQIKNWLRQALGDARRLIGGLRPPVLDSFGLFEAVAQVCRETEDRSGIQVQFNCTLKDVRLDPLVESSLFRIAQEALHNVSRHSQARTATVRLYDTDERLVLEVQDDGRGFDPLRVRATQFGLEGIRHRARMIQGRAEATSRVGGGTLVRVEVPLPAEVAGAVRSDL